MTPETIKTWQARLRLGEAGMAAYLGVPATTLRKWINGQRSPDAAPQRLMWLLQQVETAAPALHEGLLSAARASDAEAPPKRGGRGRPARVRESAVSAMAKDSDQMAKAFADGLGKMVENVNRPVPDWMSPRT